MKISEMILSAIEDAKSKLISSPSDDDIAVLSWPQNFQNGNLGFDTEIESDRKSVGDGFVSQTTVVFGTSGDVAVYHGSRFVFYIDEPSPTFYEMVEKRNLPLKDNIYIDKTRTMGIRE